MNEERTAYGTATKLPDEWIELLFECIEGKQAVIETGVREFNLSFPDAIKPAIRDFMNRISKGAR